MINNDIFVHKLIFEILTVHGQQLSFSTDEEVEMFEVENVSSQGGLLPKYHHRDIYIYIYIYIYI